ncbi:MAG: AI-2E family transporter [Gammaproteobacteria bacterium]
MNIVTAWFRRVLTDPQAVILIVLLMLASAVILLMGQMLTPVIASIVIAYLLEGLVDIFCRWRLPRLAAVIVVFILFSTFVLFIIVGLLPLISSQLSQLVQALPSMLFKGQALLQSLPSKYPTFINAEQVNQLIEAAKREAGNLGQYIVSWSLASVMGFITMTIYLVLVPLLVFFFLKDRDAILKWFSRFLPQDYSLAKKVWHEVDWQMSNYVRGKFWEVVIVWSASFVTFTFMNLQFAMLLGLMVGLSVIVPFVGAVLVTIPVAGVALYQWGWSSEFMWLMVAYTIIQALDGYILIPLLFSEVVDLHPIAIIVAILVFGGIWGFWGVFFAIPLATVVQAVLKAWPRRPDLDNLMREAPPIAPD